VQDSQGHSEQNLGAFQKEQVPNPCYQLKGEVVREYAAKPLESHYFYVVAAVQQVLVQLRHPVLHQLTQHALVN
jgi:hypothetical protein